MITAGVTEELLFRGYPIERLSSLTGQMGLGALIAYGAFVALHLPFWGPEGTVQIGVCSLVVTALYIKRRNLPACMLMHLLSDGYAFPAAKEVAPMSIVVEVSDLHKSYGSVRAVSGVSFTIKEGEIFGMVGPNGAGKTTIIECVEGLRRPDRGTVRVLGLDPQRDGYELRRRIGIQLQEAALPPRLKVGEALDLFGSFYPRRVDGKALAEQLGLGGKWNTPFDKLSGGQKRRLFIALALINDPELVFLDEPTTGLDPQARRALWDLIRGIRSRGKTIFLTTHYMEEAERLCDRVAIINSGKIVALDTPENLIRSLGAEQRVVFSAEGHWDVALLRQVPGVTRVERIGERVVVYGKGEGMVGGVVGLLERAGVPFRDLRTEQPSLEDVFLALTGREMRD